MIVLFAFVYPPNSKYWLVCLSFVGTLGLGAAFGAACRKWAKFGAGIIGLWIGGILGGMVYGLVLHFTSG